MLKVGIIGTGGVGKSHITAYSRIAGENGPVQLVACCDMNLGEDLPEGIRRYTNIDEFLESEKGEIDYIDLCLPTFLHKEFSIKAMKMGYNVLCEKPMALTYDDCLEMCKVSEETGKYLMVAHCVRFSASFRKIYEIIKSGELGKPLLAEFVRNGAVPSKSWFLDKKLSGGAIYDLSVHDVDLMNMMFGMPNSVSTAADFECLSASIHYMYDTFYVNTKCDWATKKNQFHPRYTRITFENGFIYLNAKDKMFAVSRNDGELENIYDTLKSEDTKYLEILYFADCIINNLPLDECPAKESAEAIKLVELALKSAENGGERYIIKE